MAHIPLHGLFVLHCWSLCTWRDEMEMHDDESLIHRATTASDYLNAIYIAPSVESYHFSHPFFKFFLRFFRVSFLGAFVKFRRLIKNLSKVNNYLLITTVVGDEKTVNLALFPSLNNIHSRTLPSNPRCNIFLGFSPRLYEFMYFSSLIKMNSTKSFCFVSLSLAQWSFLRHKSRA